ncbi:MAG TPA: nickel pincer cofactor biosynthesis protein LarB [Ktedonobacteraceae bacterium]|nr:nickel pincer cofactor biosynthesis protein LarB [Ktedonobacteraceae bacterium]
MNHQADEQLELLEQLLREEPFHHFSQEPQDQIQGKQENEQQYMGLSGTLVLASTQHERIVASPFSSAIETRPDPERELRKGVPEVIFGEAKEVAQVIAMARRLLESSGRTIISRVRPEAIPFIQEAFQSSTVRLYEASRIVVIYRPDYEHKHTGGRVGVISAGTSDIPVAEEAAVIAEEMGCSATCIYDVGVAGLHRLMHPLRELLESGVDAIVVAAGMDGALPSVVAGLVPVPVIGLPTSVGYGIGGKGFAALLSMLQTCAPGLTVVNIDNGIGAGSTAALIANRVAQARGHQLQ